MLRPDPFCQAEDWLIPVSPAKSLSGPTLDPALISRQGVTGLPTSVWFVPKLRLLEEPYSDTICNTPPQRSMQHEAPKRTISHYGSYKLGSAKGSGGTIGDVIVAPPPDGRGQGGA
ncbi:hypothetical protein ACLOJK_029837 [Asimina triloba]